MNSKFTRTLKRVKYFRNDFPDAIEQLENCSNLLQRDLSKYTLTNSEILKQYAISELSQIKEEKKRIESWHKSFSGKDRQALSALPYSEIINYDEDMRYYSEILYLIDGAIDDLNKHLVTYYPDMFNKSIKREKSFVQFLINIPDNKRELFAEKLKEEFRTGKGLQIRYMIEALTNLKLLSYTVKQELYDALKLYFNRDIGAKTGIFDSHPFEEKIQIAELKINSILKALELI